jgi:hypothetical protein
MALFVAKPNIGIGTANLFVGSSNHVKFRTEAVSKALSVGCSIVFAIQRDGTVFMRKPCKGSVQVFNQIRILVSVIALSLFSPAQDFQNSKLVDVKPYRENGAPIIAPNNGYPVLIATGANMMTITVALKGISYSANFHQNRDFKSSSLVVGDLIPARTDRDNLVLKKSNGTEVKARITRRERLEP